MKSFLPDCPNCTIRIPARLTVLRAYDNGFRYMVAGDFPRTYDGWCDAEELEKALTLGLPYSLAVAGGKAVVAAADVARLYADYASVKEGSR